jgi:hypothetical protein
VLDADYSVFAPAKLLIIEKLCNAVGALKTDTILKTLRATLSCRWDFHEFRNENRSFTIGRVMTPRRFLCPLLLFLLSAVPVKVHAWGCEGHEIVALITMKHLQPQVADQINAILTKSPVSPGLRRYCRISGLPLMADVASWADDIRSDQPETVRIISSTFHLMRHAISTTLRRSANKPALLM